MSGIGLKKGYFLSLVRKKKWSTHLNLAKASSKPLILNFNSSRLTNQSLSKKCRSTSLSTMTMAMLSSIDASCASSSISSLNSTTFASLSLTSTSMPCSDPSIKTTTTRSRLMSSTTLQRCSSESLSWSSTTQPQARLAQVASVEAPTQPRRKRNSDYCLSYYESSDMSRSLSLTHLRRLRTKLECLSCPQSQVSVLPIWLGLQWGKRPTYLELFACVCAEAKGSDLRAKSGQSRSRRVRSAGKHNIKIFT